MFLEFQDFNFKLLVIEVLMYDKGLLLPVFDADEFVQNHKERVIDIEEEGYDFVPEFKQYFEELPIPAELAGEITELFQDGGNAVYLEIIPFWHGEDEVYDLASAADAAQFPNLKSVTIFPEEGSKIKSEFEALGIAVEYL